MERLPRRRSTSGRRKYRDLISTVEQLQEKQRIAAVEGDDADVFGYHYENGMLAVNLFHMRGGRVLDRREFFWEELPEVVTDHVRGGVPSAPRLGAELGRRAPNPCIGQQRCEHSTGSVSSRRILLCPAEAALHRPALRSAEYLRSGGF